MLRKYAIIIIVALAFFIRLVRLSDIPKGFHVDEARVAYNAYSLLKTGRDERGNFLPLFYNSFQEFRPMGYFYASIPFVWAFGPTVFATRLAGVILGSFSVFLLYILTLEWFKNRSVALIAALFLALTPWHIILSRATSEAIGALFFLLLMHVILCKFFVNHKFRYLLVSLIAGLIAIFFYPSARVVVPLSIIADAFLAPHKLRRKLWGAGIIFLLFSGVVLSIISGNNGRLSQVAFYTEREFTDYISVINQPQLPLQKLMRMSINNPFIAAGQFMVRNIFLYVSPQFLINTQIRPARYGFVGGQLIFFIELFGLIAALILATRDKKMVILWVLLLIATLPPALTSEDSPNMQRAVLMLMPLIVICSNGIYTVFKKIPYQRIFVVVFAGVLLFESTSSMYHYLVLERYYASLQRDEQAAPLMHWLNTNAPPASAITIANVPDNHYIYFALEQRIEPHKLQAELAPFFAAQNDVNNDMHLLNYHFVRESCPSETFDAKELSLIVDSGECVDATSSALLHMNDLIYSNGGRAYRIYETK